MITLKCKVGTNGQLPTKNNPSDEGWDLYSAETIVLPAHKQTMIETELYCEFPEGVWGQIEGRSGLAAKHGIFPAGGIIDNGYTGHIKVVLYNGGEEAFTVTKGDRIAQLVLRNMVVAEAIQVDELGEKDRGDKGFGSSGK